MFSPEQLCELEAPLFSNAVKERKQGGRQVSYIEGWHAIAEANRIFGFDAWCRETVDIKCVAENARKIGEAGADGWGVSYIVKVRVTVRDVIREGCGTGHGIDRDLGQAHESALKEAETDAMKRALMTFGNKFGLALYDKDQCNVADAPDESTVLFIKQTDAAIDAFTDAKTLRDWWASEEQKAKRRAFDLTKTQVDALLLKIKYKLAGLEGKKAA